MDYALAAGSELKIVHWALYLIRGAARVFCVQYILPTLYRFLAAEDPVWLSPK